MPGIEARTSMGMSRTIESLNTSTKTSVKTVAAAAESRKKFRSQVMPSACHARSTYSVFMFAISPPPTDSEPTNRPPEVDVDPPLPLLE